MLKLLIIFFSIGIAVFLLTLFSPSTPTPTQKTTLPLAMSSQPQPTPTPTPTPIADLNGKSVFNDNVPFILQAPLGEWKDPKQQDACEEASVIMAMKWAAGEPVGTPTEHRDKILEMVDWLAEKYGESRDTSAKDTYERLIKEFYSFQNATLRENITTDNIIQELHAGNLVITPVNGQALNNPYFTQPGPERHMVLIIGYDSETTEFVTNDPGVGRGKNYRYPVNVFFAAVRDYESGYHVPIVGEKKNMIIVSRNNQKQP